MKLTPSDPRIAFMVQIHSQPSTRDTARLQHVVHLFHGHRIPCTWSVAGCGSLETVVPSGYAPPTDLVALSIGPERTLSESSTDQFRDSLRKRLAALRSCSGAEVPLVSGDPSVLRMHAAILVEQGIQAVLSTSVRSSTCRGSTPLPCGLWQMNFGAVLPGQSWLARITHGNQAVLRKINKLTAHDQPLLVSIDALAVAHSSLRSLQQLEKLLQSVSLSASRQQIKVATIAEIVEGLSASRISRPQQSILRAA